MNYLYHATKLDRVPNIIHIGIWPRCRVRKGATWSNCYGSQLGNNRLIYCFDDLNDAICWGAKMEFDLRCQAAVVEFIDDPANWQQQDDWRHEGRALQRQGGVE